MFTLTVYTISSFDGEENIVSVVHDRELVLAELNTLRDESPKFNFLPDQDELKEGLSWKEGLDYICGQLWQMENAFVNITVHQIEISTKIEQVFNEV